MSHYTYAGPFKNPTEGWYIKSFADHHEIWIRFDREKDGSCQPDRKHISAPTFNDIEDADAWIMDQQEFFEEDYSRYLEENSYEINQMELREQFLNEH